PSRKSRSRETSAEHSRRLVRNLRRRRGWTLLPRGRRLLVLLGSRRRRRHDEEEHGYEQTSSAAQDHEPRLARIVHRVNDAPNGRGCVGATRPWPFIRTWDDMGSSARRVASAEPAMTAIEEFVREKNVRTQLDVRFHATIRRSSQWARQLLRRVDVGAS